MIPLAVIANPPVRVLDSSKSSTKRDKYYKDSFESLQRKRQTSSSPEAAIEQQPSNLESQAAEPLSESYCEGYTDRVGNSQSIRHKGNLRPSSKQKSKVTSIPDLKRKKQFKTRADSGVSISRARSTTSQSSSISSSSVPLSPRSSQSAVVGVQHALLSGKSAVRGATSFRSGFVAVKVPPSPKPKSPISSGRQAKHVPIDVSPYVNSNKDTLFARTASSEYPEYLPSVVASAENSNASIGCVADASVNKKANSFASDVPDFPLPCITGSIGSTKIQAKHAEIVAQNSAAHALSTSQTPTGKVPRHTPSLSFSIAHPLEISPCGRSRSLEMAQRYQNGDENSAMSEFRNTPSMNQQQRQHQASINQSQHTYGAQSNHHLYNHKHAGKRNGSVHFNRGNADEINTSTSRQNVPEDDSRRDGPASAAQTPASTTSSTGTPSLVQQTAGVSRTSTSVTSTLSGLVCNVHRTTGREPHALVGASTTIMGDRLYVFGGRRLSRSRPFLTSDLYELDLIRRHWTKLETRGDIPAPRYFHSICTLGDTKLVCYGGMTPQTVTPSQHVASQQIKSNDTSNNHNGSIGEQQLAVMSDIHIYDIPTHTWMHIPSHDAPQGRYAHCAAIIPSSGVFSSPDAPLSAIHHNPSSPQPNTGTIGVALDGTGGAEMIVVGGQDKENHYIEQISVFNLRSLRWMATDKLEKSCGAYRSVVTPLTTMNASDVGCAVGRTDDRTHTETDNSQQNDTSGTPKGGNDGSLLIYSNYNFLQVKLELQIRLPDGTLLDKPMHSQQSPPGLRFPNGGVVANHFVVSGTFLTPSEQEYAMWALDLRTLSWSRIDAGGSIFRHGSWNRGLLWHRRNTFVVLGNRKRKLVEDYHHRRLNFSNICTVELEAFGLYDNPRRREPTSSYVSASCAARPTTHSHAITSPIPPPPSQALPQIPSSADPVKSTGGRTLMRAAQELGELASNSRELCDMDLLAIDGKRIPVNSRLIAQRWGPYFTHLMREGAAAATAAAAAAGQLDGSGSATDTATLRPSAASQASRNSSVTITQSVKTAFSAATTVTNNTADANRPNDDLEHPAKPGSSGSAAGATSALSVLGPGSATPEDVAMSSSVLPPSTRPRTLYLPHTHLTLRALVTYLYTSALPSPSSSTSSSAYQTALSSSNSTLASISTPQPQLCTPQVLCSLLQIARPYRIDGLLEAVVERLHAVLDGRNTAAIFNAAAMAAGGGDGVGFYSILGTSLDGREAGENGFELADLATLTARAQLEPGRGQRGDANMRGPIRIDTSVTREDTAVDGDRSAGGFTTSSSIAQSNYPHSEPGSSSASAVSGLSGSGILEGDETYRPGRGRPGVADPVDEEIWSGEISAVVGLQKRGLRGLMEGRRLRERGGSAGSSSGIGFSGINGGMNGGSGGGGHGEGNSSAGGMVGVGLGIA